MSDGMPDWVELGRLVQLTVQGSDLATVELVQSGLLPPLVLPTPEALAAAGDSDVVLVDDQATPLAHARSDADGWTLRILRGVSGLEPLPDRFDGSVLVVDGPLGDHVELPDTPRLWLVPAARDQVGRRLLNQARAFAGPDEPVRRLPRPDGAHRWLTPGEPPTADDIAQRLGARQTVHLGNPTATSFADRGGTVIFFTGLSGSGKSTLAAALLAELERLTDRPLTLLDGDEVRSTLSAGLGFDKASREANIRRIGWVAALASRHGGIAIAAPIAPFASGREQARRMAEEVGEFLLVWIATDLATCERRDRKGLYARARAGEVAEFTGISSPYEPPGDADLVIDTAQTDVETAVALIVAELRGRNRLPRAVRKVE